MTQDFTLLREWAIALTVLFLALPARATARTTFRNLGTRHSWPLLSALAPSVANLVYILGLRIFAELAPLPPRFNAWLDSGIYVFAVIVALGMFRRGAMTGIEWISTRSNNSTTLQQGFIPLLRNLVTLLVFFMGAIMILKRFNYDVMSLITALGVGSLAIGLAAKDTLSNMISGFMLIIDRNVRPGDRIGFSGNVGDVDNIGLRSTRLRTGDGNTWIVPNSELVNSRILNLSFPTRETTASTLIRLPYAVPFARMKQLCLEILGEVDKVHKMRGKWVNLDKLTDGYQQIAVGFWVNEMDDAGAALSDFNEKLLIRLSTEQISLFTLPVMLVATGKNS